MPRKISERQFLLGVFFLFAGLALLFNATLVDAPVKISEKGLLFGTVGLALLFFSVRFFSKCVSKK